ncbi:uncharacterized protein [Leptinotarsa decemlineata]|uniref:uncharacterized protein n=1 Tax=Leptinotarsa decemlineata TaxID=7539 RepID=UPI003D30677F
MLSGIMYVSNIKAISFLTFILANFKYGSSRPHPENFKHIFKRDIFASNPMFNRVFHSRNPEQSLTRNFLERNTFAFNFPRNGNYITRIPIEDNSEEYKDNSEEYTDQSKIETSQEIMFQSPDQSTDEDNSKVVNSYQEKDLETTPKPIIVKVKEDESEEHSSTAVMMDTVTRTYGNVSIPEPQNKKSNLVDPTTNENETKLLDSNIRTNFKQTNENYTSQQELRGHLSMEKKPAPLTKQPNTLVRGINEEDTFSHFVEETEPERTILRIPIIPHINKTKDNITNVTIISQINTTQQVPSNSPISFTMNEEESNEENTELTSLKPLIVENGDSKRLEESMKVSVISKENLRGSIKSTAMKTKIEKPIRKELERVGKLASTAEEGQKYERNHTSDEVQNFKDTFLRIWNYNPTSSSKNNHSKGPGGTFNERHKQYGIKPSKNFFNLVPESTTLAVQKGRLSTAKLQSNPTRKITSHTRSGHKIVPPRQQLGKDRLWASIFSNILASVITANNIPKNTVRVSRDTGYHRNTRMPKVVLSSAARKYVAPKYFPKTGSNVFPIPGESPVETLPANFRQDSPESIHRNLVDSNMGRENSMSLADIFSGEYQRAVRSQKWKYYLEDFEQIM